jgi:two-component system, OmpR family, response regulator RpaA
MSPQPAAGNGWSVVLVDDDPVFAEMYRLGLEIAGFDVTVYPDGPTLLRSLNGSVPHAVVLDWQMPGMFGDEVLAQLRLDARMFRTPIFILSNFPSTTDGAVDRVFTAGATAWLEKVKTTPGRLAEKLIESLEPKRESLG